MKRKKKSRSSNIKLHKRNKRMTKKNKRMRPGKARKKLVKDWMKLNKLSEKPEVDSLFCMPYPIC